MFRVTDTFIISLDNQGTDGLIFRSHQWHTEPIARLRNHMVRTGVWDKTREEALLRECNAAVEQAADDYLATPLQSRDAIFDRIYSHLPTDLAEQRDAARRVRP